jgi:hypothetical protein
MLRRIVSVSLVVAACSVLCENADAQAVGPTAACMQAALASTSPGAAIAPKWRVFLACTWQIHGKPPPPETTQLSSAGKFTTFVIPDAPAGPQVTAMNLAGEVVGTYFDSTGGGHSFLRTPDGRVVTYDPPGAIGSNAFGVDDFGNITGAFASDLVTSHGYIRYANGTFKTFDPPGSAGTVPLAMSPLGTAAGSYFTGQDPTIGTANGFLRLPNGIFTEFFVPGSYRTDVNSINIFNAVTGQFHVETASGDFEPLGGFVRSSLGSYSTFNAPNSGYFNNYPPFAINASGTITGSYTDPSGNFHGFVRTPSGTITTINAPGNNYATFPAGITINGAIAGYYVSADFAVQNGFLRTPQGQYITFVLPGYILTTVNAINDLGVVAGTSCNEDVTSCVGFLWRQ